MNIKVASQNCWLIPVKAFPPFLDLNVIKRSRLINKLIDSLDADVVLLQEVWSPNNFIAMLINAFFLFTLFARHVIVNHCRKTYKYITSSHGGRWHDIRRFFDSGLMILSKYPILHTSFERFITSSESEDKLSCKGILATAILKDDYILITATTHLDAGKDHSVRVQQLKQCVNFLKIFETEVKKKYPGYEYSGIVFAGDLNIDANVPDLYHDILDVTKSLKFTDHSANAQLSDLNVSTSSRGSNSLTEPLLLRHRRGLPDSSTSSGSSTRRSSNKFIASASTSDGFGLSEQRLDYMLSNMKSRGIFFTPESHWRANSHLVQKLREATQNEDVLEIYSLKNSIDSHRRSHQPTDHGGIIGSFLLD